MNNLKNRLKHLEEETNKKYISEETRLEVAKLIEEIEKEYNSPEAIKQRKEKYNELQHIGQLRKEAYERGESMDIYPLNW